LHDARVRAKTDKIKIAFFILFVFYHPKPVTVSYELSTFAGLERRETNL